MDIDALHSTLLSIALISEKLRSAREDLAAPDGTRPALGEFLDEMESDLRVAKATLAGELGFSLCPNCWPPELVAIDLDGQVNCPVCGLVPYEQAAGSESLLATGLFRRTGLPQAKYQRI